MSGRRKVAHLTGALAAVWLALVVFALPNAGWAEPKIIEVKSPKGITAWLVHETSIPMIALSYETIGGGSYDPPGKEGLSRFATNLLDEGAGKYDSLGWQAKLDDLAITIDFNSGADTIGGSLVTLSKNRDVAFQMLQLAMRQPRFDAEAVERIRRQMISGLQAAADQPSTLLHKAYRRLAFPNHPYGRPNQGTVDSLKRITRDDLVQYAKQRITRDHLIVGVVGDITPEELGRRLDELFADLPASAGLPQIPEAKLANQGHLEVIEKNIPQSIIRFYMPGISIKDPDFYPALVMNRILGGGGGLTSRLGKAVRVDRGLAYGVWTYIANLDHADLFAGGSASANASAKEALSIMIAEMKKLRDKGVTAQELQDAKTYINGSFPLRFTSSERIANYLVGLQHEKLGIDYISRRASIFNKVTLADVQRVAKRLLQPKKMLTIVVGAPVGMAAKTQ